jgi:hypothetical protein
LISAIASGGGALPRLSTIGMQPAEPAVAKAISTVRASHRRRSVITCILEVAYRRTMTVDEISRFAHLVPSTWARILVSPPG